MPSSIPSASSAGGYGGNVSATGFQSLPRQGMVHESVRLVTGAISRGITIVNTPTLGSGFEFQLSHSSQGPREVGVLGRGWRHNYQARLIVNTTLVTLVTGQGQHIDFIADGSGGWKVDLTTSVFVSHALTNPSGTVWKVTSLPDGTAWTFEASALSGYPETAGRLLEITDRSGNSVELTYDSSGQLTTVEEPQGRQIQLTHSGGRLTEVTGPDNQSHLLTYDAFGNLQSVSGPEGCTVSFGYDMPGTAVISAITDARGNTTRYTYTDGVLHQIFYPNSSIMTYRYLWGSDGPWENLGRHGAGSNHNTTRVIHPGGEVFEYRFDKAGNLWRVINPSGHIKRFFWNNKANLLFSSEGWPLFGENGQHGPYDHMANRYLGNTVDVRGNTIGVLDPTGIFSTFSYDNQNRLVEEHTERGHFGVQGNWPGTYGKEGVLLCAFKANGDDIYRPPSYLDSDPSIAITNGNGSGSNEFVRSNANTTKVIDPRAPIEGEGSLASGIGFWKHNGVDALNSVFEFSINLNQAKSFNLSLYSHSADLGLASLQPMTYYGEFGRDIQLEVQDLVGTQTVRIHNNAPGVWLTFPVSGDDSNPIKVIVRATGSNNRPVISALAFDEHHERRTRYEYIGGNLVKVINRLGDEEEYTYNPDGTLAGRIDLRGKTTTYGYLDSAKNLTRITDPDSNITALEYDDNGNVVKVTDANSHETVMTYDGKNRLLTRTDPLARTTTWSYDGNGNVISIIDPLLNETKFGYSETNQLAYVEDALGHRIRFVYDANGRISQIIDPRGFATRHDYDQDGNLVRVHQPDGQMVTMAYDTLNQLVALTGPNGNQESLELANLVGGASLFRNPSMEKPDPNWPEGADHWAWSDGTRVRSTQVKETGAASLPLSRDGEAAVQRDLPLPEGAKFVTQLSFKAAPRTMSVRTKVRDAAGQTSDNEQSMILSDEQNTWWKWRAMAFQVPGDAQTSFSNPTVEEFDVRIDQPEDAAGWVDTMDLIMLSQAYRYDKAGRLKTVTNPDGSQSSLHRDLHGRVISSEDSVGRRTDFRYDVLDRLVSVTKPSGETLSFQYDAAGALLQFTDGEGRATSFAYDDLGRLSSITYPDTATELFGYDPVGNLTSYTDPASQVKTFVYDDADRLVTITYPNSDTVEFTYDEADNLLSLTERDGDLTEFAYDNVYRLIQVTRTPDSGNSTPGWELHYTYDASGNPLSCSNGVTELWSVKERQDRYGTARYGAARYHGVYDGMNRPPGYLADGASRADFTYDHEGRRTDIDYANGVTSHVDYDIMGRPLAMTTGREVELLKTRYQYDVNSQRTSQLTGNDTLDYTLDDDGKLIGEAVNRLVLKGANLAEGNLASLQPLGEGLSLLSLDDDFSGTELNSDRWRTGYYDAQIVGNVAVDPWDDLGSEIRQGDGLHFVFPRGYCDRTEARDILHPLNDSLGLLARQHLFWAC